MSKTKNFNVILAEIFSSLTFIISIFSLIYILLRYPTSLKGVSLFLSSLCLSSSALILVLGIIFSKKSLISISGILLSVYTLLSSFSLLIRNTFTDIYFFSDLFRNFGINLLEFIFFIIPAVSFISFTLYSFGFIKNKKYILASLFIAWGILYITTLFSGFTPELLIVSAYILLLKYTNISDVGVPVKMGDIFSLSFITFGIYYILWCIKSIKKAAYFTESEVKFSEVLFFILLLPYTAYWYYTRYEELNEAQPMIKNRGIVCLVLALTPFFPVSLCILQRDLNRLSANVIPEEDAIEPDETIIENSENNYNSDYTISFEDNTETEAINPEEPLPEE